MLTPVDTLILALEFIVLQVGLLVIVWYDCIYFEEYPLFKILTQDDNKE